MSKISNEYCAFCRANEAVKCEPCGIYFCGSCANSELHTGLFTCSMCNTEMCKTNIKMGREDEPNPPCLGCVTSNSIQEVMNQTGVSMSTRTRDSIKKMVSI